MAEAVQSICIGPQHHGRRMSLAAFADADTQTDHIYELEHGVVVVVDVPGLPHERAVEFIRDELALYKRKHPNVVELVSGGTGSVLRMWGLQSERHPDVVIYLSAPPAGDDQPWDEWTPEIAVEVVSKDSRTRDYVIKRREYLAAGIREYWIIDPPKRTALQLIRRGDTWREHKPGRAGTIRTSLLPGFKLKLSELWAALR